MVDFVKNILVFMFLYVPPLILFVKFCNEKKKNNILIFLLIVIYLAGSLLAQNLPPFILVLLNIIYLRKAYKERYIQESYAVGCKLEENCTKSNMFVSRKLQEDYERFNFSIKKFRIVKAIKYFLFSYVIIILISSIYMNIMNKLNLKTKEQEIVTWMTNMDIQSFLIVVPVVIIFAPIVEEFVFRWIFFEKVFIPRVGVFISAILSSLIFALIHFNLMAFPVLIWIGLYNCYLIHKKGYWYSVFNHFTFNLLTTIALFVQKI